MSSPNDVYSLICFITNCRFYNNISQILLLYKTQENYNKFDSSESLRVFCWLVKIPQCGHREHGLKDIKCYVQKHIAPRTICFNPQQTANNTRILWDSSMLGYSGIYSSDIWNKIQQFSTWFENITCKLVANLTCPQCVKSTLWQQQTCFPGFN